MATKILELGERIKSLTLLPSGGGAFEIRANGKLLLANHAHEDGIMVDVPPAPEGMRNATDYFLTCISQGLPIAGICSAEVSRDAQEILEAALLSAQEGKAISLPLMSY